MMGKEGEGMDLNFETMQVSKKISTCSNCSEPGYAISEEECEEAWKAAMLLTRFYRQLGRAAATLDEKIAVERQRLVSQGIEGEIRSITFCVQAQVVWNDHDEENEV
jgi:hypothetical protein